MLKIKNKKGDKMTNDGRIYSFYKANWSSFESIDLKEAAHNATLNGQNFLAARICVSEDPDEIHVATFEALVIDNQTVAISADGEAYWHQSSASGLRNVLDDALNTYYAQY